MKKIISGLLSLMLCAAGLYAEHIKFTVAGTETRYNQIKVVNNTTAANFDCTAYFLEERDGKLIAQEAIGMFHLGDMNSSDTCNCIRLIKKGTHIGLAVPDSVGTISYIVSYKDYPLFDIIEISLLDEESPIGKEF